MNIYEILGITPDASLDDIRLAYQGKLKEIDMSRQLKDYQTLREAYNQALKNNHQQTSDIQENKPNMSATPSSLNHTSQSVDTSSLEDISLTNNWEDTFKDFLNQADFYADYSKWDLLLKPFITNETKQYEIKSSIQSFLIKKHMLLQDNIRFKLIKLFNFKESDFSASQDKLCFTQAIQTKNYLDFTCYSKLATSKRNTYFTYRYQLFNFLQFNNEHTQLEDQFLDNLNSLSFIDDDLNYLLGVYFLIYPDYVSSQDINLIFSNITTDKYSHDLEVFYRFLALIDNPQAPTLSNIDIIGLSWVSDGAKERLMTRLKQIKQDNSPTMIKPISARKKTTVNHQSTNWWKLAASGILIMTLIFAILGSMMSDDTSHESFINQLTDWDEDEAPFNEVAYKQSMRGSNLKLNFSIYHWLIYDDDIDSDFTAISDDSRNSLVAFKQKNQNAIDQLEIDDLFQDIHETHDLTTEQTLITYTRFKDNHELFLKSTTSAENKIMTIEEVSQIDMPKNQQLGTIDATLFFTDDLVSSYDNFDQYLLNLADLYPTYLTEELYQQLTQLNEEQFNYLAEFGFSKPIAIEDEGQLVILLTNYSDDYLFLTLNQELKIETIYFEFFKATPASYIEKANKLSVSFESFNPWAYELGIPW